MHVDTTLYSDRLISHDPEPKHPTSPTSCSTAILKRRPIMYERLLTDFKLASVEGDDENVIRLVNPEGYTWTISLITELAFRITLEGPDRKLPPHDNFAQPLPTPLPFRNLQLNDGGIPKKEISFDFVSGRQLVIDYSYDIILNIYETLEGLPVGDKRTRRLMYQTLPNRGYCLSEHGVVRYNRVLEGSLHLGLGEKAAPIGQSRFEDWSAVELLTSRYLMLQILRDETSSSPVLMPLRMTHIRRIP